MHLLRALAVGAWTYLLVFLALIIAPLMLLLALWVGLCLLGAAFMFFFWLLITHRPAELNATLMLLLWGAPPVLFVSVLGYYWGLLEGRRQQTVPLR